jgi:HEPN domain-containing protein
MYDPAAEARRWWAQALDDRAFVHDMVREARYHDKACFVAQQAAEKFVKACLYSAGRREVIGHAVLEFSRELSRLEQAFLRIAGPAARLDRYYIPARYPNGLPGGTPAGSYTADDARSAREDMDAVFIVAEEFLRTRSILD